MASPADEEPGPSPDEERGPVLPGVDPDVLALLEPWHAAPAPEEQARPVGPARVASWSRSSMLGAVMTGWALGLQEVLFPKEKQIVIEVDAEGEPHDLPIRLLLDPDSPDGSLCLVRRDPPPPVV